MTNNTIMIIKWQIAYLYNFSIFYLLANRQLLNLASITLLTDNLGTSRTNKYTHLNFFSIKDNSKFTFLNIFSPVLSTPYPTTDLSHHLFTLSPTAFQSLFALHTQRII